MFKWIMIIVVVLGLIGMVFLFATKKTAPLPGQEFPILSRNHVADGTVITNYNSNPPTSGDHYANPANWGVFSEELKDEQVLHNLEHGGVWISYNCSVPEDNKAPKDFSTQSAFPKTASVSAVTSEASCKKLINNLESVAKSYRSKVIMSPRAKNDSRIALAAWGKLWKFNRFNYDRVDEFVRANRNHGPEFIPD
jgi:hypothetical protein